MKTFKVQVIQTVEVTLDETKFTPEFFAEFAKSIVHYNTLGEHAEHLAWVQATGVANMEGPHSNPFVEGYGPIKNMGISVRVIGTDTEVMP